MNVLIHSGISLGQETLSDTYSNSPELIKNEPMLFSCDLKTTCDIAGTKDGNLTRAFLSLLFKEFPDWSQAPDFIVDSRVHMLMPGWYPCIPGWHHDDVPRTRSDGQPNYLNPEYHAQHVMMLINGDICSTQFALGQIELHVPEIGHTIYEEWHREVEIATTRTKELQIVEAPTNRLILFNWETFHRGVTAKKFGWRFFIRATRNTHRKPVNELRKQVQVYLDNVNEGW